MSYALALTKESLSSAKSEEIYAHFFCSFIEKYYYQTSYLSQPYFNTSCKMEHLIMLAKELKSRGLFNLDLTIADIFSSLGSRWSEVCKKYGLVREMEREMGRERVCVHSFDYDSPQELVSIIESKPIHYLLNNFHQNEETAIDYFNLMVELECDLFSYIPLVEEGQNVELSFYSKQLGELFSGFLNDLFFVNNINSRILNMAFQNQDCISSVRAIERMIERFPHKWSEPVKIYFANSFDSENKVKSYNVDIEDKVKSYNLFEAKVPELIGYFVDAIHQFRNETFINNPSKPGLNLVQWREQDLKNIKEFLLSKFSNCILFSQHHELTNEIGQAKEKSSQFKV